MLSFRTKKDKYVKEIKSYDDDDLLDKCDEILKVLQDIKDSLNALREGEIKELKDEIKHRNRFTEQLVMAMLEKQSKPSSAISDYVAKKNASTNYSQKSAKEINKEKKGIAAV